MAVWENIKNSLIPGRNARSMINPAIDWPGLPDASHWPGYPGEWRTPYWNSGQGVWDGWGGSGWWGGDAEWGDETFERAAIVFACVDLITRTLSQMPLRIMKAGLEIPDRPRWTYDPAPGVYASPNEFSDAMMTSLLLRGNTFLYSLAEYDTGYPRNMVVLNPDDIHIERIDGVKRYFVGWDDPEYRYELDNNLVCHIKYLSWPGDDWGYGPLGVLGRQLGVYRNLDQYSYNLSQDGVPWGVLSTDAEMDAEQASAMKDRWLQASAERRGAPAILSGGLKLQTLQLRPEDMALLDLSQMSERRIAMAFGIQPYLLGIPVEGSSGIMQYANVTMVADLLWRLTLRPIANTLSQALTAWALPYGSEAFFDSDTFVRPDAKTRAETMEILIRTGVMDSDEARRYQGLPPKGTDASEEYILHKPGQEVV